MHFKTVKNIAKASFALAISLAAMTISTTEAHAQDLIARQAPVDRKMKAVDSVVINRAIKKQLVTPAVVEDNFEQTDLYTTWNTKSVHCYGNEATPDHYRIDLRGFAMPTPSKVVTSNFGYRASFGRMHKGLDVKVYIGDTIVSAFDGKVRIVNYEAKGYGNYVVIRHGNGLETIYGHLSKHLCKVGDVVRAGQPIGLGGNTGRSTGSHLHFETRILGEAINPALLFDFVHQDVTCDFYDYRRNSKSPAGARTQTASTSATKPAAAAPKATQTPTTPKPAAKPTVKPAATTTPKEQTPAPTPKGNSPAKTPVKDAATAKATPGKATTTSSKNATAKTEAPANSKTSTERSQHATAKASPTTAKASSKTTKASTVAGKASTSSAKTSTDAPRSNGKTETSGKVRVKSAPATQNAKSGRATAKAEGPKTMTTSGHSKKA